MIEELRKNIYRYRTKTFIIPGLILIVLLLIGII